MSAFALRLVVPVVCVWITGGCAGVVQYTDELRDDRTDRTLFVRTPATIGGLLGFAVGLPVSVVGLPVTYPVYLYEHDRAPLTADPVSTMLFPSFVLWRVGALIAAPFDGLEWVAYRAWRHPTSRTREEAEAIELRYDEDVLQSYPVEPLYPLPGDRDAARLRTTGRTD